MKIKLSIYVCCLLFSLNVNALSLNIPSYPANSVIPDDYTFNAGFNCSGENISPQLIWNDIPQGTQSFAVVFIDENFDFLHWKLYNIDPSVTHIPENNPNNVGVEAENNFGVNGYAGPCPPSTTPGNYVMTVYALNTMFANEPSVAQIQAAAIESDSWLAFRNISDSQQRYEYMARYRMTFIAEWSDTSHPIDYPNNAHFAPLVGNTHQNSGFIWREQQISSDAMKDMAEVGNNFPLRDQIANLINNGNAEYTVIADSNQPTASIQIEFEVSESHPLFSIVGMIAPSPDWFVGVSGLDLRQAGEWQESFSVDLFPYDAGTDSGTTFESPNSSTVPRDPIVLIEQNPFPNGVRLGRFVFERLSVAGTPSDIIFKNNFE